MPQAKSKHPIASVTLTLPESLRPLPCTLFLKYSGRILAIGKAPAHSDPGTTIPLHPAFPDASLPHTTCELWAVCHTEPDRGPYAGFGDHFHIEQALTATRHPKLYLPESADWRVRRLSLPENLLTVHYHRYDGNYDNVGLWTWDAFQQRMPRQQEIFPSRRDDDGLVFEIDTAGYGVPANPLRIGMTPRLCGDWHRKDGEDRFWTPDMGRDIFLIGERSDILTTRPMTDPHVTDAHIDTQSILHLDLSHPVKPEQVTADAFLIERADGARIGIASARPLFFDRRRTSRVVELVTESPLDVEYGVFRVSFEGHGPPVTAVPRDILDDPTHFLDADANLGATLSDTGTVFRVFAPTAESAAVALYDHATGSDGRREIPMQRSGKGVWTLTSAERLEGKFYNYLIRGAGFPDGVETTDIHATNAVDSSRRARITAPDPQLLRVNRDAPFRDPALSPVDAVIWEVHVRDFSISPSSGMRARGQYLAFTEQGTTSPDHDGLATGVDHLAELGVTHVQILPVHDYEGDESHYSYNWGYMTNLFNSPEGAYASSPMDESRVVELKAMVNALHQRGIGVILDVVYNHTGTAAPFNRHVPKYYYRLNPDGSYSNGSGTGNEFRSESPMGRKHIIDTLVHWVREYDIDGFRFDLMALIDRETMRLAERELRKLKPAILLYGEPWQAAASPLPNPTDKHAIADTGIGAFNDDFRNAVKGDPGGGGPGFIQNGSHRFTVEHTMAGSRELWAASPAHAINYMTCHDNLVLFDKLKASHPRADEELIQAMARLGYLILLTSQGVPFLHAGCEFLRTKHGDHNSYQSPDAINQIDWTLKEKNRPLFEYVRKLITLRKSHPLFRLRTADEVARRLHFHFTPTGDTIIATIDGRDLPGEPWRAAAILLNAHDSEPRPLDLPDDDWKIAFDRMGNDTGAPASNPFQIPPKSGILLACHP